MTDYASKLAALEPACTTDEALALFDELPAARSEDLLGPWTGRELATGNPMDGLLVASGWYGKHFDGLDSVHPLVFKNPDGKIWFAEPRKVPLGMLEHVSPLMLKASQMLSSVVELAMHTRDYRARLRNLEHRGVTTAAMIYDHLPIIDVFRQVDDRTLLGVMDMRGMDQPYFFILTRE